MWYTAADKHRDLQVSLIWGPINRLHKKSQPVSSGSEVHALRRQRPLGSSVTAATAACWPLLAWFASSALQGRSPCVYQQPNITLLLPSAVPAALACLQATDQLSAAAVIARQITA
jgi:hypothetical protein